VRTAEGRAGRTFWVLTALALLLALAVLCIGTRAVESDGFCGYVSTGEMLVAGACLATAVFLVGLTTMAVVVYRHRTSGLPDERPLLPRLGAGQFEPPGRRAR